MNTERLFTITKQVGEEISQIDLAKKMNQLQAHLQAAINTPNESTQRTVEDALTEIYNLLEKAPSNEFSPGIRANLRELKINNRITVDQLIGTGLSGQLDNIFKGGYTSVKTLDLLKQLVADIKILGNGLGNVTNDAQIPTPPPTPPIP